LSLMNISVDWKSHLFVEYSKDKFACEMLDGKIQDARYKVVDDIIYYKNKIYLVQGSHDSPLAGHQGFFKTYRQIRERFTWKNLKEDVLNHVKECSICQQNKAEHIYPAGLLQPLPIPDQKWESISMDFITSLPKIHGKDSIYVVVDKLTKFSHFFAIPSDYLVAQVAELFFQDIFRLHRLPKTIVSDRDSRFMGGFWQELFRLVGTKLTPSTNYHPQTDGQT